jgi:hypothetical protein
LLTFLGVGFGRRPFHFGELQPCYTGDG